MADEGEGGWDTESKIDVKAVLTLIVGLSELSSSVASLPLESCRDMTPAPISFLPKPSSSLADRAKSFSTLGVRKICRFFLRSEPLDDRGLVLLD